MKVTAITDTTIHFETAHALAADLAGASIDPNEAQKVLAYARSKPGDTDALFDYLRMVVSQGGAVIRSGRTLSYYRDLEAACKQHLRPIKDYDELLQTFGWSLRLLRYYRAVPDSLSKRDVVAKPTPPPPKPVAAARALQPGDRLRGKITRVLPSGHVFLELPDEFLDPDGKTLTIAAEQRAEADLVIPAERHSGKGIKVGNTRWVEVVEIHQRGKKLLIEVKPTTSPQTQKKA
jgi:hypothetical protein